MLGIVDAVERVEVGTWLTANLAMSGLSLSVANARLFDTDGGVVIVGNDKRTGTVLRYNSATVNDDGTGTIALTAGSTVTGTASLTKVLTGAVIYYATLYPLGKKQPVRGVLSHKLRSEHALREGSGLNALVEYEERGQQVTVTDLLGADPSINAMILTGDLGDITVSGTLTIASGGTVQLSSGASVTDAGATALMTGDDSGSLPSGFSDLGTRVTVLEAEIGTGGGGGSGNIAGGHWGDDYGSSAVHGGHWGDTYA